MPKLATSCVENVSELIVLAQTYFDAAFEMDATKFASIFHESSSVTRRGDRDSVVITPIASWLETVRGLTSPRQTGGVRADQILSMAVTRDMALLKLRLRIPPREVTDLLSCFYIDGRWQIVQKVFTADAIT